MLWFDERSISKVSRYLRYCFKSAFYVWPGFLQSITNNIVGLMRFPKIRLLMLVLIMHCQKADSYDSWCKQDQDFEIFHAPSTEICFCCDSQFLNTACISILYSVCCIGSYKRHVQVWHEKCNKLWWTQYSHFIQCLF